MIDSIPLVEIVQIKKMGDDVRAESAPQYFKKPSFSVGSTFQTSAHQFLRSMRLDTDPEGYNSGRTYYLQANTDEELERLVQNLNMWTKKAKKRFEARSVLERSQRRARMIYNSLLFQCTTALFMLLVRPCCLRDFR